MHRFLLVLGFCIDVLLSLRRRLCGSGGPVSAMAAPAVAPPERTGGVGGSVRRRLWSVPAQAGPVVVRGPAHPLVLGRDTRARLGGAVRALLNAPGLDGALDAVRLSVIVLASRTPSESGVVKIRTSELGRWLGLSASYVASSVVPALRASGVVAVDTAEGEFGQDVGLECRVLPLWAAQGVVGHPLALEKKELATLLRLLEAVMAPGWVHRDGRATPAGLLGSRTGRGAATDRLALLLLVLEARETGQVRLRGGIVDTKRGRAAATVARLLGCTAAAGERVLERLEDRGLVQRVRVKTASRLAHRTRLIVPAVAAAHGTSGAADALREDRAAAPSLEFSDPDVAAGRGGRLDPGAESQVSGVQVGDGAGMEEPDVTASLHTDHPAVGTHVSPVAVSRGFSGESRGGEGRRPERACVREDHAGETRADVAATGSLVVEDGPLRGEKPKGSRVDGRLGQRAAGVVAGDRLNAVGGERAQQRRAGLPDDLRLRVALRPVSWLCERLSGWQQDQVAAAAKAELTRLEGLLALPGDAPQLLAGRLADRLEETGGEALVTGPYGWLIRRGLVQRPACSDRRCDDGIRVDTGGDCENCANVIHLRRARRAQIRADIDRKLPGLGAGERWRVLEEQLREHAVTEAERARGRHARAAVEVAERRAAVARRRERETEAERARRSAPCAACGLPDAAGLCPACSYAARTDRLVQEAVDLAVAVRADLDDPEQVASLTDRCAADTRALVDAVCRRGGGDEVSRAYAAQEVAQRIRDERRVSARRRLMASEEAQEEASALYAAMLRRAPRQLEAAVAEGERARARTAEYLLSCRLGQLQAVRTRAAAGRVTRRRG